MASHREGVIIVVVGVWKNIELGFLETQAINYVILV